jgi:N utilization substance protein B
MKRERRRVRTLALQTLYEVDTVGHPVEQVLARHLEGNHTLSEDNAEFMSQIVKGVLQLAPRLDEYIADCAPEWPIDQIAVLDRNILRMAVWEIAVSDETPLKVAINEAVELAKRFGSDSSARFINGVLGSLAKRSSELRQHFLAN